MKSILFRSSLFFMGLLFISFNGNAQVAKIWEKPVSKTINWQQVTSLGNLIVCTNEALEGVNTEDGAILWNIKQLKAIPQNIFRELPGSPYFKVTMKDQFYLIDQFSGQVVFDSKSSGVDDISRFEVLPKAGIFLVSGNTKSHDQIVLAVSLSNATVIWKKINEFKLILGIDELSKEELILVSFEEAYRLKSKTGELVWKNKVDKNASEQLESLGGFGKLLGALAEEAADGMQDDLVLRFFKSPDRDFYIIGAENKNEGFDGKPEYSTSYRAYKLSDGSELWRENMQVGRKKFKEMAKTIEQDGRLGYVLFQKNDFLILSNHPRESTVNKFDYETGKGKWGEVRRGEEEWGGTGIPVKGSIYEYIETKNGILMATRVPQRKAYDYYLTILDPSTGAMKTKSPTEIEGEIVGIVDLGTEVYYLSDNSINIINTGTGELKWKKGIKTRPDLTAEKNGKIYLHDKATGGLKVLDLASKELSDLNATQLNFGGKETPGKLELLEDGIVLHSSQNIAKYSYDGSLQFNNHYPAPGQSGFLKGLNIAGGILLAFVAADSYTKAGQIAQAEGRIRTDAPEWSEFAGQLKNAYVHHAQDASAAMMSAFKAINSRYKATAVAKNYNLVMTKREKNIELLKISKKTGEAEGSINLGRDREPVYAVDRIAGKLYYLESGKSLVGYKLD